MKVLEHFRDIKNNKIKEAYIIAGDEQYLISNFIKTLKTALFSTDTENLNYQYFDVNKANIEEVINTAKTVPFLTKMRLVVIDNIEKAKNQGRESLINYLANPSKFACIVVLYKGTSKLPAYIKKMAEHGELISFKHPYENELGYWVKLIAKRYGKTITDEAILLIIEIVGNNLSRLDNEINKLSAYVGNKKEIELADAEEMISHVKLHNIFELTDALGDKDTRKGLKYLKALLSAGEHYLVILAMIIRYYKRLLTAKLMLDKFSRIEIAGKLGVSKFFMKNFLASVDKFEVIELKNIYSSLAQLDKKIKTGRGEPKTLLERFVVDTCR